jgi:microcystin-dependent protein
MNKTAFFVAIASAASVNAALADSGQPFDNLQPSLAVTELMLSHGVFPSFDESEQALGGTLGFVYDFAGSSLPGTTLAANGQVFPVGQNNALFALLEKPTVAMQSAHMRCPTCRAKRLLAPAPAQA